MKKTLSRLLYFLLIAVLSPAVFSSNPFSGKSKIKTGYYVVSFKPLFMLHVYIPSDYSADKKYPFLLCLHRPEGNGEEFMNILQNDMKPYKAIIACPDSENHYTWGITAKSYNKNTLIIKKTLRYLKNRYSINPEQTFLLGQGGVAEESWKTGGAYFLLYLINCKKEIKLLKDFSGFIVSGAEFQVFFDKGVTKLDIPASLKPSPLLKPILYLQSRRDSQSSYLAARWTRDQLRKVHYPVHYMEGEAWDGFPISQIPVIMDWLLNEQKNFRDDIEPETISEYILPTDEFSISATQTTRKGNLDVISPLSEKISISLRALKDLSHSTVQEAPFKVPYTDVEIRFKAYNEKHEIVHYSIYRFTGLEPGQKSLREYSQNNYAQIFSKSEAQIDHDTTFISSKEAIVSFPLPKGKSYQFASFQVFKSGHLAAFSMYPKDTDHRDFKDLAHITLPVKKEETGKNETEKTELKLLPQKTN